MIYEIISKNDVPTSQMHIYLKNKTGNDGDMYPELFNDLSISESVNSLYAFAMACVVTNNFTDMGQFLKGYPSKEVAILGFIQYIKGMATSIQLNNKCVNERYENLTTINQLGMAPTILNIDGDLIYKHYDNTKYFSKEAADEAEDSFPYWVIKIVKEIKESNEIFKPKAKVFKLPYYIQNIGNEDIPIVNKIGSDLNNMIGFIPPSGIDSLIDIKDGYGVLGSAESAYVLLTDKLQPYKHVTDLSELDMDNGTLKLPSGSFKARLKDNASLLVSHGINSNYYVIDPKKYIINGEISIKGLFHNNAILETGIYAPLHSDYITIINETDMEPAIMHIEEPKIVTSHSKSFEGCKYLVIIPMSSEDIAIQAFTNIHQKTPYKDSYIDVDLDNKVTLVVYGDNDSSNAIKVKKKILAVFGYKAMVIEYDHFYK